MRRCDSSGMSLFQASVRSQARAISQPDLSSAWFFVILLAVVGFSLFLRIVALQNVTLLDDHDSTFYIKSIEAFSSWQWAQINALNSDSTPVYSFISALVTGAGFSAEFSARLVSITASCFLVLFTALISARLHSNLAGVLSALFLAINPLALTLSVAVLTETLYQALIYAGMYLLIRQYTSNTLSTVVAATIALLLALSFLTKTEGILFLLLCPLVLLAGRLVTDTGVSVSKAIDRKFMVWTIAFMAVFTVIATAQIMHVSSKMGTTALNGRVAWQLLAASMPDKSVDAAIYGLDFDEGTTNIVFARSHYAEAVQELQNTANKADPFNVLVERVKLAAKNIDNIYRFYISSLFSPLGMFFLFFGVLGSMFRASCKAQMFLLFMLAGVMVAPVIHTSVIPRQMAQAAPLFSILQAIGVLETLAFIRSMGRNPQSVIGTTAIVFALVFAAMVSQAVPVAKAVISPSSNQEYSSDALQEPADILRKHASTSRMSARKQYLSYLSGMDNVPLPYTDLDKLISYLKLNRVDYVYLDYQLLEAYPFIHAFINGTAGNNFTRLWTSSEAGQLKAELYRLSD